MQSAHKQPVINLLHLLNFLTYVSVCLHHKDFQFAYIALPEFTMELIILFQLRLFNSAIKLLLINYLMIITVVVK